jgi:hypothetical protein
VNVEEHLGKLSADGRRAQHVLLSELIPALVKMLLFGLVVWLVGRSLVQNLNGVRWQDIHLRWGYLAAAWALRLLQMTVAVTAYRMLLGRMCQTPSWPVMFGVITVSSMGKYIPGRLAGLVGGVWMLGRRGVPVPAATGMIFMGRGLATSLDLLVAVPLLLWQPISQRLPLAWLFSLILTVTALVFLHPKVFLGLGNAVLRKLRQAPLGRTWRFRDYLPPLGLFAVNIAVGGVGLWLTALASGELSSRWMPILASAGSLTAIAGLLAFFAPGGLGISEGVLLLVLGQIVSPAQCAVVVITSRLMWTSTEILLAASGLAVLRLASPAKSQLSASADGNPETPTTARIGRDGQSHANPADE